MKKKLDEKFEILAEIIDILGLAGFTVVFLDEKGYTAEFVLKNGTGRHCTSSLISISTHNGNWVFQIKVVEIDERLQHRNQVAADSGSFNGVDGFRKQYRKSMDKCMRKIHSDSQKRIDRFKDAVPDIGNGETA